MKTRAALLMLAAVLTAGPAYANTIDIRVLSARYTATVSVAGFGFPVLKETETATDVVPVAVSLSQTYCDDYFCGAFAVADASADLLEVSVEAYSGFAQSWASVDSAWTFAPLSDGLAEIGVVGSTGFVHSAQSVTLFDVTTNQQLWTFAWQTGTFNDQTMLTPLNAAHVYAVHLTAEVHSSSDATDATLRLSGLQAVPDEAGPVAAIPEPATLLLLGSGLIGAEWKRRRRHR